MSQADGIPAREASPEAFEATLEALVTTAKANDVPFDRSWTFRHDDPELDDVMVEISRLAPRPELADRTPTRPTASADVTTPSDFETVLDDLLAKGQDAEISFDRSWTFRNANPDGDDVMVEVTRLAKPT